MAWNVFALLCDQRKICQYKTSHTCILHYRYCKALWTDLWVTVTRSLNRNIDLHFRSREGNRLKKYTKMQDSVWDRCKDKWKGEEKISEETHSLGRRRCTAIRTINTSQVLQCFLKAKCQFWLLVTPGWVVEPTVTDYPLCCLWWSAHHFTGLFSDKWPCWGRSQRPCTPATMLIIIQSQRCEIEYCNFQSSLDRCIMLLNVIMLYSGPEETLFKTFCWLYHHNLV